MPGPSTDPGLALLTGPSVPDILDAALTPAGGTLLGWTLRDVDHRPGDRTTASYDARVAWADGEREETFAATVSGSRPSGGLVVTDGDRYVQVWRFPFDPELPGLAAACFPSSVGDLLRGLGLSPDGVQLRVVSYRPRKRAVVEVVTSRHRLFVKVLRPRQVRDVDSRHRVLTAAGVPVPRTLGWSDDGIIVLAPLRGTPLRVALESGATALRDPGELVATLDRLPPEVAGLPRRAPWSAHASHYAGVIAAASPSLGPRVRSLAATVSSGLDAYDEGDEPTYGDFYDAQLFVEHGAISGLLDIDTIGPGRRSDDLGCLLAHLSVLATGPFAAAAGARAALTEWLPLLSRQADPAELRLRAAGVTLSLATGPYRAQDPDWERATADRVGLAERWLDAAAAGGKGAAENALMRLS
ncbi:phosphotransferase [Jiangella rhizosphaerae]|uniref:Aminoglycoside phosphotransferase n=1 Tax=Jiangella rhizosphaerae TaxID=2293569 RepID=A0A418KP77_9ACTN|nr:phosphotransferase [Jiangella rhizosphaerae]RIQ20917.1 aminoglycoside phosphotransferase [Jiangella rhizosphaerae]